MFVDLSSQKAGRLGAFNTAEALVQIEVASINQGRLCKLATYAAYRELSSDNYKSPQRQLKLPTSGARNRGAEVVSPRLPWGTGGEKSPWGFRGKLTGSSCLSSAGFGAAAPCVLRS